MSSKLQALRERRNAKAQEAQALNAKYPADQRMPAEDAGKLDSVLAEVEAIDGEIAREKRVAELAGEQFDAEALRHQNTIDPSRQENKDRNAALRSYLSGGLMALTQEQRSEMLGRQSDDIRNAMNLGAFRNAMSTTTPAEGGYTTAPEYQTSLETALKAYGQIFSEVSTIRTASGTQMNFPTSDPTAEVGEIIGQNSGPPTVLDTTFGNATLDVYKYSSKSIALPWELIQDSFIDIEGYINGLLAMRLGRIQSQHFTTGTGSSQPRGIVTAAGAGKVGATGQTTTVTYDDLVDMQHSIDPAYRGAELCWMMHDTTLKGLRKLKDGQNRPIFVPGYETGVPGGAPDMVLGKRICVNQDMAVPAANAKSILYGDYKKYIRRVVMDLTLFRMTDSAYTLKGQVGFVAFNRVGGNLIDVGGAVKYYQNSAT